MKLRLPALPILLLFPFAGCSGDGGGNLQAPDMDAETDIGRDQRDAADGETDASSDGHDGADLADVDDPAADAADGSGDGAPDGPDTVSDLSPADGSSDGDTSELADTEPAELAPDMSPTDAEAPSELEIRAYRCPDRDPSSTIYITEVMIDPNNAEGSDTATEWFEVVNTAATSFDLAGITVRDEDTDAFIVNAPGRLDWEGFYFDNDDTLIRRDEFVAFYQRVIGNPECEADPADPACKAYFGSHFYVFDREGMAIGNAGDEIYLEDERGRVLDCIEYDSTDEVEGVSFQRIFDDGEWTDEWCITLTSESLRYNDNADDERSGDFGTPGEPTRCW